MWTLLQNLFSFKSNELNLEVDSWSEWQGLVMDSPGEAYQKLLKHYKRDPEKTTPLLNFIRKHNPEFAQKFDRL